VQDYVSSKTEAQHSASTVSATEQTDIGEAFDVHSNPVLNDYMAAAFAASQLIDPETEMTLLTA
jgi:hypothetical protein